jgi:hypothetical protein
VKREHCSFHSGAREFGLAMQAEAFGFFERHLGRDSAGSEGAEGR